MRTWTLALALLLCLLSPVRAIDGSEAQEGDDFVEDWTDEDFFDEDDADTENQEDMDEMTGFYDEYTEMTPEEAKEMVAYMVNITIQLKVCKSKKLNKIDPVNNKIKTEAEVRKEDKHLLKNGDTMADVWDLSDQLDMCLRDIGEGGARKRAILNYAIRPQQKWDKEILYHAGKMSERTQKQITAAVSAIRAKLGDCLVWKEVSEAECKASKNCMIFQKDSEVNTSPCCSCSGYTNLGRIMSPLPVVLMECEWDEGMTGIIIHELGHALGMPHTQNRKDRDGFVTIQWANIQEGGKDQYMASEPELQTDYDGTMKYDYDSIMHYGTTTFGNGKGPTMISKDTSKQDTLGKAKDLSPGDVAILKQTYCPASTPTTTTTTGGGETPPPPPPTETKCLDTETKETVPVGTKRPHVSTCPAGGGMTKTMYRVCTATGKMEPVECEVDYHGTKSGMFKAGERKATVLPGTEGVGGAKCPSAKSVDPYLEAFVCTEGCTTEADALALMDL